jgi:hypothetical protein
MKYSRSAESVAATKLATKNCAKGANEQIQKAHFVGILRLAGSRRFHFASPQGFKGSGLTQRFARCFGQCFSKPLVSSVGVFWLPQSSILYTLFEMPRIEYKLSFENYLEMTCSRREKKDFRIPAVSAILGFFFIAAGYLLLRINIEASFFPGGLLLATGLLLTFLAEYDLFYADKRAISFDENGWRLLWYEGEDVRPWSCLREVYDLKTLLVLGTGTTNYWLPKDSLEAAGQLDHLKALAESFLTSRQQVFQVPLRPSAQVYLAAKLFHNWRRQLTARLLCYAALMLVAYWILFSNPEQAALKSLWLFALVPFFLCLCEGLYYFVKHYTEDWSKASQNVEIMSDCILYKTLTTRWIAEYRQLLELREIPGAFLLYFDRSSYHLIPKRGFSQKQVDQFRDIALPRIAHQNVSP